MSILIDTNIAVHIRDGDEVITTRLSGLAVRPKISIITRIELEGGVYAKADATDRRKTGLRMLLAEFEVLDFDTDTADAYRTIVAHTRYSRAKIFDRMIAATAIVHDLTLITINGEDFLDIPGLALEVWPHPAAQ